MDIATSNTKTSCYLMASLFLGILPGVRLRAGVSEDLGSSLLLLAALEDVAHPLFNVVRAWQFRVEGLDG